MPTWYRAPSAPAANRPAHGTPQQAPGGGTAAHASSRHPSSPSSMRTPHSQHTSPRTRIQQAPAYERPPRAAANGSPGIPFSGEVGARCEQPASPENGAGLSANPIGQQFLFPVLANLELHDACPPRNLIRQFPHRPKTAFPASASFPVRNISAPSVPQTPPQPTARRPVHGSETAAHAPGDRPVRGRRAPDAPHFAPML